MGSDTPTPNDTPDHGGIDIRGARVEVAQIDAEQLRNAVSARLFGAAAEPVKIGRFTVLRRLGAGGMGVVYSAYDEQLDRKVAIKLLHGDQQDTARHTRLLREAQALARLSHPNVVHVYEVGTFRDQVFVAMEFVLGKTLARYLQEEPRDGPDILGRFTEAGRGLAAAHAAGLVHRDFKPDNVLVSDDGRTLVVDFGLARATDPTPDDKTASDHPSASVAEPTDDPSRSRDSFEMDLTRTGAVLGTPAYMAPEQHRGTSTDTRSDQFSFCVALWEALAGERPFEGNTVMELAIAVNGGQIRSTDKARPIPGRIKRALQRGLSPDRADRFPTMQMLLTALAPPRDSRRVAWLSVLFAVSAALGVTAWFATQNPAAACTDGTDKLVGVWDTATRDRLEAVFLASPESFAGDAWKTTEKELNEYARQWQQMHLESCETAFVRSEQSPETFGRRMMCLRHRLTALEQLVSLLGTATEYQVKESVDAAIALPPVDSCAEIESLMDYAVPLDKETQRQHQDLNATLARGQSALDLGQYPLAGELGEQALATAERAGSTAHMAKARFLVGVASNHAKQYPAAASSLREAARLAAVLGDQRLRLRALSKLIRTVGHRLEKRDEAAELIREALGIADSLKRAPVEIADLHMSMGTLAKERQDYAAAVEYAKKALGLLLSVFNEDHTKVASAQNNLGNALKSLGRRDEAEKVLRTSLASFEHTLGPRHPNVAIATSNLASVLLAVADERSLFFGKNPPEVVAKCREAETMLHRVILIRQTEPGAKRQLGKAFHNLGDSLRCAGQFEQALKSLRNALRIKEIVADDPRNAGLVSTLNGIARCQLELGDTSGVRETMNRVKAIIGAKKVKSVDRGEANLILAESISRDQSASEPPAEAVEHALSAKRAFLEAGPASAALLREADRWLSDSVERSRRTKRE